MSNPFNTEATRKALRKMGVKDVSDLSVYDRVFRFIGFSFLGILVLGLVIFGIGALLS